MEGPEGRVICHECLLALRRGVGPAGRGNSGGDAIDKEVGCYVSALRHLLIGSDYEGKR